MPTGFDDPIAFGMELDVVAHATAEGASRILDNGQAHEVPQRRDLSETGRERPLRLLNVGSTRTGRY